MNVLLFGSIAEKAGSAQLEIEASSTGELDRMLRDRIEGIRELAFSIAVDRKIEHRDRALKGSEEVAILPPFAGG